MKKAQELLHWKGGSELSQAAQESGGIIISKSVEKVSGWGTWGYGLVGNMVVPSQWLDSMFQEVFSNPHDSTFENM